MAVLCTQQRCSRVVGYTFCTVGVLWERGVSDGYQFITFTRFDKEFVETGKM